MPTVTPSGNRYMLTLIDDYSRFTVVRLVKSKDEVTSAIKEYVAKMKNRFGKKPIAFRTDNGKEYVGLELKKYFREEGIEHQRTVPYTPQQNGVAERKNRSLTEMAKCMLLDAGLHNRFWGEAVRSAAYLQNRIPSRCIDKTPYELFFGRKPELGHVRVFGSKVFCFVPKQRRRKWDDKAVEGVLIGYDDATKGYRILDPKTDGIWISRSVRIVKKAEPKECATALEPEGELERGRMISQHIDVRHHQLRNLREQGIISIEYCPTENMTADIFHKAAWKGTFPEVCRAAGPSVLQARVGDVTGEKGCWKCNAGHLSRKRC
uniref:Integrase catalytic domain-containing protein n=1 Tax=Trichuris muris TaxID=70415 RepID=A0A5S6Q1Z4_TRIMR